MTYQLYPAGAPTDAYDDSTGEQYRSSISPLADGGAVLVFETHIQNAWTDRDIGVVAQRYDANGAPVGAAIEVVQHDGVERGNLHPKVAGLEGGGFAVAWNDIVTSDVRVQVYDAAGALLRADVIDIPDRYLEGRDQHVEVNGAAGSVAIAALNGGGFAVSFDGDYAGILAQYAGARASFAQAFDASGAKSGAIAQITPYVASVSYGWDLVNYNSDIIGTDDGGFLVLLRGGEGLPGNESDHPAVVGRLLNASGVPQSEIFMVSDPNLDSAADAASVAKLENGDFIVAYRGESVGKWRRFDSDMNPVTEEMDLDRHYVALEATAMSDGGFLITDMYSGYNPAYTTFGHRFDSNNEQVDERFVITERHVPADETNYYGKPLHLVALGNGQLLGLIEGHASWNGDNWEVMTWLQQAETLGTPDHDTLEAVSDAGTAMFGRAGDDMLQGGAGPDNLDGGQGDDTLAGGAGNDTIRVAQGDDVVMGGAGSDLLFFEGVRADGITVRGPADALSISYLENSVVAQGVETYEFSGGYYSDVLTHAELLERRDMTVSGSSEPDSITGDYGNDLLRGYDGNDEIDGGAGRDTIDGGHGADTLYGRGGDDSIVGGPGSGDLGDSVMAGDGNDTVHGGGGDDTVNGGFGFDSVHGGDGDDSLIGLNGFDTLYGEEGADSLIGNFGNDMLDGGAGNDTLEGGLGFDVMLGGAGDDSLQARDGYDTLEGAEGNDTLQGNNGNDSLSGGADDDLVQGGLGADILMGDAGNDQLEGANGFDQLDGGEGEDVIIGGAGNDTITGGAGDDTLRGGIGADTFVFNQGEGSDLITDFQNNIDEIQIDAALMSQTDPVAEDLRALASFEDGALVLTFENGQILTLTGVGTVAALLDDVVFV
ncbi:calcium-binding protein [Cognatishimia sp. F0-27]|uniref:calcium-binding protein n=1 Tax=Cognatishimia sp. F0-27 TaxID=2816855 RepID=UPI001D0C1891|nr:calcium-binding protein [Cognatishimia sp. F0-27]MCC1494022.1 hypothetical protein [Cognatishimia sp. F0-27]